MIVLQQIQVLPAGSKFRIYDMNRFELEGEISRTDKSPIFNDVRDAERFHKIYSNFHVELLDVLDDIFEGTIFTINVR